MPSLSRWKTMRRTLAVVEQHDGRAEQCLDRLAVLRLEPQPQLRFDQHVTIVEDRLVEREQRCAALPDGVEERAASFPSFRYPRSD
jgi:hypothetical protein